MDFSTEKKDSSQSLEVILRTSSDWNRWLHVIRRFSQYQGIWPYIDPDVAEKPVFDEPVRPETTDINPTALTAGALTQEEKSDYDHLYKSWKDELIKWDKHQKALSRINEHITKTVGSYYGTIADETDVAQELALLKAQVKPTDWVTEQEVLDRYNALLRAPNRTKISKWVNDWQVALREAKRLGLAETTGLKPTRAFLQAVSPIDPSWANYWLNEMDKEAHRDLPGWKTTFPDGQSISGIFERSQSAKRSAQSSNKGAFATYQGVSDDHINPTAPAGKTASPFGPNNKPQCICGLKHWYSECYYLDEAIRPAGWKPKAETEAIVKQKLQDPAIKGRVERSIQRRKERGPQAAAKPQE
ncbi:hypothetical protein Egran_06621, partial [Elaphomyces granulatus]